MRHQRVGNVLFGRRHRARERMRDDIETVFVGKRHGAAQSPDELLFDQRFQKFRVADLGIFVVQQTIGLRRELQKIFFAEQGLRAVVDPRCARWDHRVRTVLHLTHHRRFVFELRHVVIGTFAKNVVADHGAFDAQMMTHVDHRGQLAHDVRNRTEGSSGFVAHRGRLAHHDVFLHRLVRLNAQKLVLKMTELLQDARLGHTAIHMELDVMVARRCIGLDFGRKTARGARSEVQTSFRARAEIYFV